MSLYRTVCTGTVMGLGCPVLPKNLSMGGSRGSQITRGIQRGVLGCSRAGKVDWHQRHPLGSGTGMCEHTLSWVGQLWMSKQPGLGHLYPTLSSSSKHPQQP